LDHSHIKALCWVSEAYAPDDHIGIHFGFDHQSPAYLVDVAESQDFKDVREGTVFKSEVDFSFESRNIDQNRSMAFKSTSCSGRLN
jgi:hypothetical protein